MSDISMDVTVDGLAQATTSIDQVAAKLTKLETAHDRVAAAAKRAVGAVKSAASAAASAAGRIVQVTPTQKTPEEKKAERDSKIQVAEWKRGIASRVGALAGGLGGSALQVMGAGGSNGLAAMGLGLAAAAAALAAFCAASDRAVQAAENETKARQEWTAKLKSISDQRGASAYWDYQKIRDPMRRLAAISSLTGNADLAAQAAKAGVGVDSMGGLADLLGSRRGAGLLKRNGLDAILSASNRLVASGAFGDQGAAFKALGVAANLDSATLGRLAGWALGRRIGAEEFDLLGAQVRGTGSVAAMADTDKLTKRIDASKIANAMNGDMTWQGANNAMLDQIAPAARAMSELGKELANLNEIARARAEAESGVSAFLKTFTTEGNETTKMIRQMRGAAAVVNGLSGDI